MDQLFGLYFLYVIEFMKKNNSNFNYSKRRFNFFIIINLFFISIFGSSKVKIKKNEIKHKNYIWFLNENDK